MSYFCEYSRNPLKKMGKVEIAYWRTPLLNRPSTTVSLNCHKIYSGHFCPGICQDNWQFLRWSGSTELVLYLWMAPTYAIMMIRKNFHEFPNIIRNSFRPIIATSDVSSCNTCSRQYFRLHIHLLKKLFLSYKYKCDWL